MSPAAQPLQRSLQFGSVEIKYSLAFRAARRLDISVEPNLDVSVLAPHGAGLDSIEKHVRARASWIFRQQLRFQDLHPLPTPKRFVSGESHRYLGRQYRLKVVRGDEERVSLDRPFLLVRVSEIGEARRVETLVSRWIRERAEHVLPRQLDRVLASHPVLRKPASRLRIRSMDRRWGSCSPNGTLSLNPSLVQAPLSCIEYVLVHELCHRHFMNHGPSFLRLLSRVMPDWRTRRDRLNQLLA